MEGEKAMGITTIFSLLILTLGYFLSSNLSFQENNLQDRLSHILDAMLEIEKIHSVGKIRIAVGYGACLDIYMKASDLFGKEPPPIKPKHHGYISSFQDLKEAYALFFSTGSAAERFVSNDTLFKELVHLAQNSASSHNATGGNAASMARRFAMEGASVMFAANREKYLMDYILPNIVVAGGPSSEDQTDIHLLLEFLRGEKWGKYIAPRANRFIVHKDRSNPRMAAAAEFGRQLETFRPHLLVIGGLQVMDNFPYGPGEREKHLSEIQSQISFQPKSTLIHFEMASFTDENLLKELSRTIIPSVDSLGMNEQELPNIHGLLKYNNVSIVSQYNPRVAEVLDQMRDLFKMLGKRSGHEERPLTRLHVHTLAFQAIMIDRRGPWKHARAAVTKAALVAHRYVCHKEVEVSDSNLLMDEGFSLSTHPNTGRIVFDDLNPVSCWSEETHFEVCIAPVLVCTKVRQTAGGGDNISAAGLILQV